MTATKAPRVRKRRYENDRYYGWLATGRGKGWIRIDLAKDGLTLADLSETLAALGLEVRARTPELRQPGQRRGKAKR